MDKNYELIIYLLKKHYPERDFEEMDESDVYQFFYDHYNICEEDFDDIIKDLLPLCTIAKSELTDKWYRGFGTENTWLIKQEIK
jgi:hypothetical protein